MEAFPVEVIGKILSHVAVVEEVVRASGTCRKWREAARRHLHVLTCNCRKSSPVYKDLAAVQLEVLLTETILQTSRLQELEIWTEDGIAAATLISWLLHTRESLRILRYRVTGYNPKKPLHRLHSSKLERCAKMKRLEFLDLDYVHVIDVQVTSWPSLVSLVFGDVSVSVPDLNSLFSACPKLESFTLRSPTIVPPPERVVYLVSSTLKAFQFQSPQTRLVYGIVLEAAVLERLYLKYCKMKEFHLVSNRSLRVLKMKDACLNNLDIDPDTDLLEVLHVNTVPWPKFGDFLSRIPNLKKLKLRGIENGGSFDVVDFKTIGKSFPCLKHLSMTLNYEAMLGNADRVVLTQDTCLLEKLVVLQLKSSILNDTFCRWIELFLGICPSLKRLVVRSNTQETQSRSRSIPRDNPNYSIGGFFASFVKLMHNSVAEQQDGDRVISTMNPHTPPCCLGLTNLGPTVHFIICQMNPETWKNVENHLKNSPMQVNDKLYHVYTSAVI